MARMRWASPYLNPALRRISDFVLKNPALVKGISIAELATACDVSESTVTRFVRAIDVPNFQQFKIRIAEELTTLGKTGAPESTRGVVYEDVTAADTTATILDKISGRYVQTAHDTLHGLSISEVDRAVDAIQACELMAFFALGSSILSVENALLRFMRVGKQCQFFRDFSVRQISTATLNERSLAIGISNSGRTITTVDSLKEARARGARTICITSFPDSPITQHADIRLFTPTVNAALGSADYHESMVSKIAQLQVMDILYTCFAVRNYDQAISSLEKTEVYATGTRV